MERNSNNPSFNSGLSFNSALSFVSLLEMVNRRQQPSSAPVSGENAELPCTESQNNLSESQRATRDKVYIENKGTVLNVTINTLCNIIGGGIISLPLAFYRGSIVISIILFFICVFFSGFTVFALSYGCEVSQRFNYSGMVLHTLLPICPLQEGKIYAMQEAISKQNMSKRMKKMRKILMIIIEFILFFFNFGTLIIYSRAISDSIPPVLSNWLGAKGVWLQRWFWLLIPSIAFVILGSVRSMHELKWSSFVGFLTIFYVFCLVIARYFTDKHHPVVKGPGKNEIRWIEIKVSLLSAMSQFAFALSYHYNVPNYYRELKDRRPAVMLKTVYLAIPIVSICYVFTGLLGYLTFGALVNSKDAAGNIMNNFTESDIAANIGRLGLFFHFTCVYPIVEIAARRSLHRIICLLFEKINQSEKKKNVPLANEPTAKFPEPSEKNESKSFEVVKTFENYKEKPSDELPSTESPSTESPSTESPSTESPSTESPSTNGGTGEMLPFTDPQLILPTTPTEPKIIRPSPPGDPSTTSRRSIIIEAIAIVVVSTLVAAFVSGVGVVVELIGCLFGFPLVFIMPACVGISVFKEGVVNMSSIKIKIFRVLSWFTAGLGVLFMICGLISFFIAYA